MNTNNKTYRLKQGLRNERDYLIRGSFKKNKQSYKDYVLDSLKEQGIVWTEKQYAEWYASELEKERIKEQEMIDFHRSVNQALIRIPKNPNPLTPK